MATFQYKRDFEVWLAQQPQEVSVAIAARGALRVWPLVLGHRFWKASEEARKAQDTLTLLTGWATMVAGVAATAPDPDVQEAAEAAYVGVATAAAAAIAADVVTSSAAVASVTTAGADAVAYAADTADSAACAATRPTNAATFAAGNAAGAVDSAARATAAATIPSASKFAAAAAFAAASRDCDFSPEKMLRQPLWHDIGPPVGLLPEDIGETLFDTNPQFGFFKRWYDGMNGGVPVPVDLCSRIVTQIPSETWESGAQEVAAEIARIEAAWLAEQAAHANRAPEFEPDNVAHLLDHPRSVSASVALSSITIKQSLQAFSLETAQWLNELPDFLKPLEAVPASLDRIVDILATRSRSDANEQALREEIGRLNAQVARLEAALAEARKNPETKEKPWFGKVAVLGAAVAAISGAVWTVSGDDLGPVKRCEMLSEYWDFFGGAPLDCVKSLQVATGTGQGSPTKR
jgi:hypothetical protein